jgi:mannosyltransferase
MMKDACSQRDQVSIPDGIQKMKNQECNTLIGEKYYLAGVVLLAVVVRLIRLGTFPFWGDESLNLAISQNLYAAFFKGELIANHPPLPYILLAFWRFIGMGYNEWTLRALPFLFGVMGVGAIFWFAKKLFGAKVGLLAALLLAISPFHVLHSQDLKEYIYLPFLATITAGFFYCGVEENKGKCWFFYGLFAGICCYAEAFAAPFLLVLNLWFLMQLPAKRSRLKGWFFSNIFGALLFLPWLGIMLKRVHMFLVTAEHWWIPWPNLWSVLFYFKTIAYGYTSEKPFFYLAFVLFAIAAVAGSIVAVYKNPRAAIFLILWATLPVAIIFALSYLGQSIFLIRAMLPYSLAVYILIAVGIAAIPVPSARVVVIAMVAVLCSVGLFNYYARNYHPMQHPHRPGIHPPRDYKEAAQHIRKNLQENDLIIHASQATWFPFQFYALSGYPHYVAAENESFKEMINSSNPITTTYEDYLRAWPKVVEELVDNNHRVWFIFSEWERGYLPGNAMSIYRWLDSKLIETEHTFLRGIDIILYQNPHPSDMPEVIARDEDTGVTSLLTYASTEEPYLKIVPDAGLVEMPLEQRKGNLELRFSPESDTSTEKQTIAFSLENKTDHEITCNVMLLHSSYLFSLDSFEREDTKSNEWNYTPHWNINPPPADYNLGVVAAFLTHGTSTISRTIQVRDGIYVPYVYSVVPWDRPNWKNAPVTITAGEQMLVGSANMPELTEPRWTWVRGNDFVVDAPKQIEIEVSGTATEGLPESYANMGYLALIEKELIPEIGNDQVYPSWPGEVKIPPQSAMSWTKEMNPPIGRVDVWAFERNDVEGKAYHIFEITDTNETVSGQIK